MNLYLWANIIVCVFAFCSFICGAVEFFKPRKALYGKMITGAMICIAIGRIFNIVRLLTGGNLYDNFQLGTLGVAGSFLFLFSANYGAIDSIVDDKSEKFIRYRLAGLIIPVLSLCLFVPVFFLSDISLTWKVQAAILYVFVAGDSYYHMKHLLIPDVDFGVVKGLRLYNFFSLFYIGSSILECFALSRNIEILVFMSCVMSAIFILCMMVSTIIGLNRLKKA